MSNPIFSIIIPTFNAAKTLDACLKSVLKQTLTNFEVLIMDGVSNDSTLAIANSFNDSRVRVYSEPDKGIYDAMNKGIEFAKGTWLYFLGGDDELYEENILSKVATVTEHSIEKIIYGNVLIHGDAGWAKDDEIYAGEFNQSKLKIRNICHQALFYHKSVFSHQNYDIKDAICADYALNRELFDHYKFKYISEIIAIFKGGGKSFIKSNHKSHNHLQFYRNLIHKAKIIKSFITTKRAK